jgi:hypothetical protein
MIGFFKCILGTDDINNDAGRDEFARAKNELARLLMLASNDFGRTRDNAVTAALKMRSSLSSGLNLSVREKIEIVKLINQAKVRAISEGTTDGYRTFQMLDSVSEDIRRYL